VQFNASQRNQTATIYVDQQVYLQAQNFFANISVATLLAQFANFSANNLTVDVFQNYSLIANETDVTNPQKPHINLWYVQLNNGAAFYLQGRSRLNVSQVQADPNSTFVFSGFPSLFGNYTEAGRFNVTDGVQVDQGDNFTTNATIHGVGAVFRVNGSVTHTGDNATIETDVDVHGSFAIHANNFTVAGKFSLAAQASLNITNVSTAPYFAQLNSIDAAGTITFQVADVTKLTTATVLTYPSSTQTANFGGSVTIVDNNGNVKVVAITHSSTRRRLLSSSSCSAQYGQSALTTTCSSTSSNPGVNAANGLTISLSFIALLALIVLSAL